MEVAINMRVVDFQMGGQQRAAAEVANRLAGAIEIRPTRPLCGLEGHLWEQFALPMRAGGRLLWSPSATGPLAYSRQVVTVHDVAFLDVPECFSAAFRHLYAKVTPALMRRVAKVVTVSEFSRRRIVERTAVDPDKVVVIGNGVSDQFQIQDPLAVARTRAALQLPERYFLITATSRRKNAARALRAWRAVSPSLPDDLWLIVSGSRDCTRVTGDPEALEEAPRTRFIGYVAEEHLAPLIGGALVTGTGLVFSGSDDGRLYAFDAQSGAVLWSAQVGLGFGAAPITYEVSGTQYLAIAAGGSAVSAFTGATVGGTLFVFKLGGHRLPRGS